MIKTRSTILRPWMIVVVAALAYMAVVVAAAGGDPLVLATLGSRYAQGDPNGTEGYDGQFAYYIARDPLNGWQHCDEPAYRYQRILYPLLARLLAAFAEFILSAANVLSTGLGQEALIPYSLALINVVALGVGTWLMERVLRRYRMSPWYAITYGLYAGQLISARLDLNEPLAHAFVVAAILVLEGGRGVGGQGIGERGIRRIRISWWVGTFWFALAALTKETALVFVAGYLLYLLAVRQWRRLAGLALGVGVPFLVWQGVLWAWLGSPGVGSGGAGATGWEVLPFRGLWSVGAIDLRVLGLLALMMVPLAVIPTLLSLWAAGRELWKGHWHPFTAILLTSALMMLFLPQSTYREPLAMLRLTTGLVIATILYGARRHSRQILNYTLLWLASLVFLTKEGTPP